MTFSVYIILLLSYKSLIISPVATRYTIVITISAAPIIILFFISTYDSLSNAYANMIHRVGHHDHDEPSHYNENDCVFLVVARTTYLYEILTVGILLN